MTIAEAFRAYLTEPARLPGLLDRAGLPADLRAMLAERRDRRR